eukprot:2404184-Karenia_brevis.AAC.1
MPVSVGEDLGFAAHCVVHMRDRLTSLRDQALDFPRTLQYRWKSVTKHFRKHHQPTVRHFTAQRDIGL